MKNSIETLITQRIYTFLNAPYLLYLPTTEEAKRERWSHSAMKGENSACISRESISASIMQTILRRPLRSDLFSIVVVLSRDFSLSSMRALLVRGRRAPHVYK